MWWPSPPGRSRASPGSMIASTAPRATCSYAPVAARAIFSSRQAALVPSPQRGLRRGRAIHPYIDPQPPREGRRRVVGPQRLQTCGGPQHHSFGTASSPVTGASPARRSAAASRRLPYMPRRGTRRVLQSCRENSNLRHSIKMEAPGPGRRGALHLDRRREEAASPLSRASSSSAGTTKALDNAFVTPSTTSGCDSRQKLTAADGATLQTAPAGEFSESVPRRPLWCGKRALQEHGRLIAPRGVERLTMIGVDLLHAFGDFNPRARAAVRCVGATAS